MTERKCVTRANLNAAVVVALRQWQEGIIDSLATAIWNELPHVELVTPDSLREKFGLPPIEDAP